TELTPGNGVSEDQLLTLAAAVEEPSEHPLARAILGETKGRKLSWPSAADFQSVTGKGVSATVDGARIFAGTEGFMEAEGASLDQGLAGRLRELEENARTTILIARDKEVIGLIGI